MGFEPGTPGEEANTVITELVLCSSVVMVLAFGACGPTQTLYFCHAFRSVHLSLC